MNLVIIVPNGKQFELDIVDWVPRHDNKIGIAIINKDRRNNCKNAMEYYSIPAEITSGGLLLLERPKVFRHNPRQNEIILNYS